MIIIFLIFRSSQRRSVKSELLKISQNSQENNCARDSLFHKDASLGSATLLKNSLWNRCFPVNLTKFLKTPFLTEHLRVAASVYCLNLLHGLRLIHLTIEFPKIPELPSLL